MEITYSPQGIYLPDLDLWLDPAASVDHAWLSHAHSDHARGAHRIAFGTPETLAIYRLRWASFLSPTAQLIALRYHQRFSWRGASLTVYPAAHILGAAQLLIEYNGFRLGYTGDIKLRAPLCGAATQSFPCDRLIIECTFGLPIYHTLERDEARARILAFARDCLENAETPVFLGYPLGRGQEIAHTLCQAGVPTTIHGAIARYLPFYEAAGYAFPSWRPYDASHLDGVALVTPPGFRNVLLASRRKLRIAYVSGWAALANARARVGAEELIPYSDHADFSELLELIRLSGAREIHLVHGYAEPFGRYLTSRGYHVVVPHSLAARSIASEETDA